MCGKRERGRGLALDSQRQANPQPSTYYCGGTMASLLTVCSLRCLCSFHPSGLSAEWEVVVHKYLREEVAGGGGRVGFQPLDLLPLSLSLPFCYFDKSLNLLPRMTLNLCFFCLHLPSAGILGISYISCGIWLLRGFFGYLA